MTRSGTARGPQPAVVGYRLWPAVALGIAPAAGIAVTSIWGDPWVLPSGAAYDEDARRVRRWP